jgi:tRNA(Met) cytidine acetyltransferase
MNSMLPQRQCVFLIGDKTQWQSSLNHVLTRTKQNSLVIGDFQFDDNTVLSHKQAQQQLGKEFSTIVFDASEQLYPDSFGAIIGTLTAGGVLVVLLGEANTNYQRRFQKIAHQVCQQSIHFHWCESEIDLAAIELSEPAVNTYSQTHDQQHAVEAIIKVVTGHRKRPLVLTSDRGRGKTAALGIAAAQLLKQGKQNILVTAPSLATVDTLFKHAQLELAESTYTKGVVSFADAEIRFIAPDRLIETLPKTDLLIIDEAAAIPSFMLEKVVQHYSRLVFATTLHGYEGTGRGFALRFQNTLQQAMPDYRLLNLTSPIRWAEDDQLDAFSFDALLLDAEAVDDQLLLNVTIEQVRFEQLDQTVLSQNDLLLRQVFGLMALAHYRTRPSDLQRLLDASDVSIYTLTYQQQIVACAWLIEEGELEQDLSEAIFNGARRPNGHLLPQSLLAHAGIANAGQYRYQRVARIVIHPVLQRRGFGDYFMAKLTDVVGQRCDCLGASFAANDGLLNFWLSCGFKPVRLGQHQDDVSGSHALMMLKPCSDKGHALIDETSQRLKQQWPFLLQHMYTSVDCDLLISLSRHLMLEYDELSSDNYAEVKAFSHEQRAYESCQYSLWQWTLRAITTDTFYQIELLKQRLLMRLILQQQPLPKVASELGFSGKKQLISELRTTVSLLLD